MRINFCIPYDFIRVSTLVKKHSGLDICTARSDRIKVLQWQCLGEPIADKVNGVIYKNDVFYKKARNFIEIGIKYPADLLLSPEYSFPYKVLDEIIENNNKWPPKGKLWCLGTQGDNYINFEKRIEGWTSQKGVHVFKDGFIGLTKNNFVSPLIYLFLLDDGELCVVPQFKLGNMLDKHNRFEGPGLCRGKNIFIFDLCGESKSNNIFLSLICSDVLHFKAEYLQNIKENNITIFHPQLNEEPRNSKFLYFRESLFGFSGKNFKLITLNWSDKTYINGTKITFNKPWSAYYQKGKKDINSNRKLRNTNYANGTPFLLNNYTEIWYSQRHEHCKLYEISKHDNGVVAFQASHCDEPSTEKCYVFDNSTEKWLIDDNPIKSDLNQLLLPKKNKLYDYPLLLSSSDPDKCDFFFGSCFGHFEEGEIITETSELVNRMIIGSDYESDNLRKSKSSKFAILIDLLKKNKFPSELMYLKNNYEFYIDSSFPDIGKNRYNLRPLVEEKNNPYPEVLVVISEHNHEGNIEKEFFDLTDMLHKNYREQIIIYYVPHGKQKYIFFDKHLDQKKFTRSSFTNKLSSIRFS